MDDNRLQRIAGLMRRVADYNHKALDYGLTWIGSMEEKDSFRKLVEYVPRARIGGRANRPYALHLGFLLARGGPCTATQESDERTIPFAAAAEMANCTITYNYDRIIDDDSSIGSVKALHRSVGVGQALLAGDALASVSRLLVLDKVRGHKRDLDILWTFERIFYECDVGQHLDIAFGEKADATASDAANINDLRTGQFIRRCAEIGALIQDVDTSTRKAIAEAFSFYGRAVQDANDYQDLFPIGASPGSHFSDIRLWKKTKPLIWALEMASGADQRFLRQTMRNSHAAYADYERCATIVKECGAADRARRDLFATVDAGISALDALSPSNARDDAVLYFEYIKHSDAVAQLLAASRK